jgi:hypothetical protein
MADEGVSVDEILALIDEERERLVKRNREGTKSAKIGEG